MQIELKVPSVGESITEVEIGQWLKNEGDSVSANDNLVAIESEKTTLELPAPASGALQKILKRKGEVAKVGERFGGAFLGHDGDVGKRGLQALADEGVGGAIRFGDWIARTFVVDLKGSLIDAEDDLGGLGCNSNERRDLFGCHR